MQFPAKLRALNFNLDSHLNPYLPRSRVGRLPYPIAHFFGYRKNEPKPLGNVLVAWWSFFGAFCGILALEGFFHVDWITDRTNLMIVGSFGAGAVLEYGTITSPLAQPRNLVFGQLIAIIVGVCIKKLFALSAVFASIRLVGGALAVGITSALMVLTGTIHPPAGATAVLAVTSPEVEELGWIAIAAVLVSSLITLGVALLINNIQRRFPIYWWTPEAVGSDLKAKNDEENQGGDSNEKDNKDQGFKVSGNVKEHDEKSVQGRDEIIITADWIQTPDSLELEMIERNLLETLQSRLKDLRRIHHDDTSSNASTVAGSEKGDS